MEGDRHASPSAIDIVLDKVARRTSWSTPTRTASRRSSSSWTARRAPSTRTPLDEKLAARGLPAEWSDVIISSAQNSEPDVERFEYPKQKQDELIEYFKLTPAEWERWNTRALRRRPAQVAPAAEDPDRLRPPAHRLRRSGRAGHVPRQAAARPQPAPGRGADEPAAAGRWRSCTGVVVDYFGVFDDMEKALNFDENIREESLIDWDALRAAVPGEVARCMEQFEGITIEDTRECLLAALRRLREPEAAKIFEQNFREPGAAVGGGRARPVPLPAPPRVQLALRDLRRLPAAQTRRRRDLRRAVGEDAAADRREHRRSSGGRGAAGLPHRRGLRRREVDQLPTPVDKAAALEAAHARARGGRRRVHVPPARRATAAAQRAQGRRRRGDPAAAEGARAARSRRRGREADRGGAWAQGPRPRRTFRGAPRALARQRRPVCRGVRAHHGRPPPALRAPHARVERHERWADARRAVAASRVVE